MSLCATAWAQAPAPQVPAEAQAVPLDPVAATRAWLDSVPAQRRAQTDAYFEGHPYLTEEAAVALVDRGAVFVGIDSLNIDDTADKRRPVHTTLLGNDIPIGEHLCGLAGLPASGTRFFAVPVKVKAFGTFPVRAFAKV